ncbi:MAG: prepilin-type N-terminal cleavage/methylation domain-containing protein [Patescibacteria group bacterium]
MITKTQKHKNTRGFTMIELLVATTLFVVVIGIASGLFIQSLRSQRATMALMAANDNASLTLEQMSREIRIGSMFSTNSDGTQLSFTSQRSGAVIYRFDDANGLIERNGIALTSDNVEVVYLYFDLMGEELGDGQSTRVTIRLGVSANDERAQDIVTRLQTTVSSRQLDT